jgi:hypothetical protein
VNVARRNVTRLCSAKASVAITRPGALLNATAIGDGPTGAAITGGVITCNHKLNNNSTVILCRVIRRNMGNILSWLRIF